MGKEMEDRSSVPQIVLIYDGGEHFGVQGSYCWSGVCVDYTLPSKRVDFVDKLSFKKGVTVDFKVVGAVVPDQLHVTVFSGDKIVLHKAVYQRLKIEISKGTYFLNVKATWSEKGDASNVFLIEVL
jgi:hypothetical protein